MLKPLTLVAACAAMCAATPSTAAELIDISVNASFDYFESFHVVEQTVMLPAGFSNAVINIRYIGADDSAVLQVNGTNVASWGIYGPGTGSFAFSADGPFVPFEFTTSFDLNSAAEPLSVSAPFMVGNNTIKLFQNNTMNGIQGGGFSFGPGSVELQATVTYSVATPVPEPENWLMMLAGGGLLAAALRRRSKRHSSAAM